ncbi:MAG: MBL fold metallo-hydrolase [Sedimentisphaerales bacterium]|nr:MBL fold metallo-hydrolase [Sedimentisphaerales bacterium]
MKIVRSFSSRFLLLGLVISLVLGSDSRSNEPVADFNGDRLVNLFDFSTFAQYWLQDEPSVDIAPVPTGDNIVNYKDLYVLSENWLRVYEEIVYIQWLGHSSIKVWAGDVVIYIDPRNLSTSPHDATAVLVTHSHSDHYQPADIARVSGPTTKFLAPANVVSLYGRGQVILPGQTIQLDGLNVIAVPAYNTNHPKSNNWVGYIIELASRRIYIAGDTDLIEEMKTLGYIDVAILPAGGTYTMNAQQAADATKYIKPLLAIPYHWGGGIVGTLADAQRFANLAACNVKIMSAGEILSSQDWLKDFSLIAHWKLDDAEGTTAVDSAGDKNGTVNGNPLWKPAGGKIDGALQLDGEGDYISVPFVLNPAGGRFSVFAWIKGGAPGQVILSQIGGVNWLSADLTAGNLMTDLKPSSGRNNLALSSQTSIIDNNWHRVGFVWDGSYRILYVDDVVAAKDTAPQGALAGSNGGLQIGADKSLNAAGFWNGLIDDVRIHNRAVTP